VVINHTNAHLSSPLRQAVKACGGEEIRGKPDFLSPGRSEPGRYLETSAHFQKTLVGCLDVLFDACFTWRSLPMGFAPAFHVTH
jgi:hypothetical protein